VVDLGGQGPLASSPRFAESPSPNCPALFKPQHLTIVTIVSSCGKKQPRITGRFSSGINMWDESVTKGLLAS